jgi:hypothetical protein
MKLFENVPKTLQDKYGELFLAGDTDKAEYLAYPKTEADSEAERMLIAKLQKWVRNHDYIRDIDDIKKDLVKLSKLNPKLIPENGIHVYRGTSIDEDVVDSLVAPFVNWVNSMWKKSVAAGYFTPPVHEVSTQVLSYLSYINTQDSDQKSNVVSLPALYKYADEYFPDKLYVSPDYKLEIPTKFKKYKYTPNKLMQSWSIDRNVAVGFSSVGNVLIEDVVDTSENEYFLPDPTLYVISGLKDSIYTKEKEVIRISKRPIMVTLDMIQVSKFTLSRLFSRVRTGKL